MARYQKFIDKVLLFLVFVITHFVDIIKQVELSMKASDIFIGTILRSLEIEDQYCYNGTVTPRYLARSFIDSTEATTLHNTSSSITSEQNSNNANTLKKTDSEESFFEAPDDFDDPAENPVQHQSSTSEFFSAQGSLPPQMLSLKPPSFSRIPGLIPDVEHQNRSLKVETDDTLHSFVKAQIVIYDQNSPQYNNLDTRVRSHFPMYGCVQIFLLYITVMLIVFIR